MGDAYLSETSRILEEICDITDEKIQRDKVINRSPS